MKQIIVTACIVLFIASAAQAEMRITEWMYNGTATGSRGRIRRIHQCRVLGHRHDRLEL